MCIPGMVWDCKVFFDLNNSERCRMFSPVYLSLEYVAVTGPAIYIFTLLPVKSSNLAKALEVLLHSFLAVQHDAQLCTESGELHI